MIKQLYIKNFTLIDTLDIRFDSGFSVITGETGAGKSIILGALSLLLGQRADSKTIRSGKDRCVIEAHFDLSQYDLKEFFTDNDIDYDAEDCIIRRELTASGKSRSFINDTPTQLSIIRDLGEHLVDIHSQHQNLLLNKEDFQLNVVDIIADNKKQLESYKLLFDKYKAEKVELDKLIIKINKSKDNEDFLRFQFKEIDDAKLTSDEQDKLEQESELLNHTEDIKNALYNADSTLNSDSVGIIENLLSAVNNLHSIENVYPDISEITSRLDSCCIELKDISRDISSDLETIEFDPDRLKYIEDRLDLIYSLQKKYHVDSIDELLKIHDDIQRQLELIDDSDEELNKQTSRVEELKSACIKQSSALTTIRKKSAKKVEDEMRNKLVPLGIPNVKFHIEISDKPLSENGSDKVSFLFSANASSPLQPISQVASGGEIARLMLSLKAIISNQSKLSTIIFDEIDTGVSGKIAEKMAQIMQEMGNNGRQVISITHLPQIAALGKTHYKVFKEDSNGVTNSKMIKLTNEERITEIAQMLSGSNITDAAISNAKELLKL
jgi:DNA repair protein RecN (Recombination protein N)